MSSTNDISILYEDEFLVALNKPCGLVANISQTSPENTLQNYLQDQFEPEVNDIDSEYSVRSGLIHRLDKDTSGIILAAKNPDTFRNMIHQFKQRLIKKEYIAVVIGRVEDEHLEIDAPIKRDVKNRLRMTVSSDGKPAKTEVHVTSYLKKESQEFTVLRVLPITGRTHQIRVHLLALNHPVVGDVVYLTKRQLEESGVYFNRLMLHARKITFFHPDLKKEMLIEAPLPLEFEEVGSN